MENKEIKIKSYQYMLQNLLILFTIILIVVFASCIFLCKSDYQKFIFISVMVSLITLCFICAFITRLGCRTFDFYSECGIKRIRGKKVIFNIAWNKVKSSIYYNIGEVIILSPFVLNIDLLEPLKSNENRSYDNKETISTPMSKKILKQIASLMPIEIKNLPSKL